jgi:hypothetical protein
MTFVICDPSNIASSSKRNPMTTVGKRKSLSGDTFLLFIIMLHVFLFSASIFRHVSLSRSLSLSLTLSLSSGL